MILKQTQIDEHSENNRARDSVAFGLIERANARIAHDSFEFNTRFRTVCDTNRPNFLQTAYWRQDQQALTGRRRLERAGVERRNRSGMDDPTLMSGRRADVVRMVTPEEHINAVTRLPLPPSIQFSATIHQDGLPALAINPFPPYTPLPAVAPADNNYTLRLDLADEIRRRNLRSEEEIVTMLRGRNPLDLGPVVTVLDNASTTPVTRPMILRHGVLVQDNRHPLNLLTITEPNARAIAKSYRDMLEPYTEIERILADGGVSRTNVITALDMLEQLAHDQPGKLPDVLRILQGTTAEAAKSAVEQLQAKKRLLATLHSLGAIPSGYAENLSFGAINRELESLQLDLQNLSDERDNFIAGNPTLGRTFRSTLLTHDRRMTGDIRDYITALGGAYDPRSYERIADTIQSRSERLFKGQEYMSSVSDKLEAIYEQAKKAGLKGSATLNDLVDSSGKVILNKLNVASGRSSLAEKLADELKVGSEAEIDKEIAEKNDAEAKAKKGGDRLRGLNAVKRVYEEILRLNGTKGDLRVIAEKMAIKNEVGFQERELMMKMIHDPEVMGEEEHTSERMLRQFTQLASGTQEALVVNLAEVLGVKRNHGTWAPLAMQGMLDRIFPSLGFGRGTRHLGLIPKINARPAWGELDFDKLMIAFFALRKATKDKILPNSSYLRNTVEEIGDIILNSYTDRLLGDLGTIDQKVTKEDGTVDTSANTEQVAHLNERKQRAILSLFGTEAESEYESKAAEYLQVAQTRTAAFRKATGRVIKKTATTTWKTGVSTVKGVGRGIGWIAKAPFRLISGTYKWLRSPW